MRNEKENRPKIDIELMMVDNWLNALTWSLLGVMWFFVYFCAQQLPETIPTHLNAVGEADGWGGKATFWLLPILGTAIFALLTFLMRMPEKFNYAVVITPENAPRQYTNAVRMMRFLRLAIILIFSSLLLVIWQISMGQKSMGAWLLPFVLGMVVLPMGYFIWKSLKK